MLSDVSFGQGDNNREIRILNKGAFHYYVIRILAILGVGR